jgi:hypothetical protein
VVTLRLVGFLELGVSGSLCSNLLQVIAEFGRDLVLGGENEHAADGPEHLLPALRLQLVHSRQSDLGLHLLRLRQLQRSINHAELLHCGQEVALVLTELKGRISGREMGLTNFESAIIVLSN